MSGFKYKGTDLSEMIGTINQNIYITDSNTTTTLSQYYNPLTNNSGPVLTTSIARLGSNTLYNIPVTGDIKNSVIATYDDFSTIGGPNPATRPSWSTSCSVILIGAGGSGASGTQGFNPSPGQSKNAQQGNCGGGGGAGGIVACSGISLNSNSQILITVGAGGAETQFDQPGLSGGVTSFEISQAGTSQFKVNAEGGFGGNLGQSSDTQPGVGGDGGFWNTIPISGQVPGVTFTPYVGKNGQNGSSPGPSNASQFTYCNGGNVNVAGYNNIFPVQIISNGGGNQQQQTLGQQYGVNPFPPVQGYGAGGPGGAGGTQGGPGPVGSKGGYGGDGFVRIYWLNTA
jgi:hypothetical protein